MKFLKFRYIFTLAIVLVIGITLMVYFFGGLSATALDSSNLEFTYEGYMDYSEYDSDGNRWVVYESLADMNKAVEGLNPATYEIVSDNNPYIVKYKLSSAKIVAQNEKYTMFLDERTTIITVGVNATATPTDEKTEDGFINYDINSFQTKYNTALKDENNNDSRSNFLLRYVGSNGKISSLQLNTFSNSVQYHDLLTDRKERHYKIKFDIENGIEILYEIGEFTVIQSFFPEKFNRDDLFDYFRGNLVFSIDYTAAFSQNILKYTLGYTWSKECADYLEERGLATVTPVYSNNGPVDEEGNRLPVRYNLTDILETDEEGRTLNVLKMKLGEDYNPVDVNAEGASPCVANPYANEYVYSMLFNSYYKLLSQDEEENKFDTEWREITPKLSPVFRFSATGYTQYTKLYEFMYKRNTDLDPNYFYETSNIIDITNVNYSQYKDQFPGINIGDKITIKTPILYFEDLDKVVRGYYDPSSGDFFKEKTHVTKIEESEDMNYIDLTSNKAYIWNGSSYEEEDRKVPIGGFHARDEEGNFLYDEEGNPIQDVLKVELANVQNENYGVSVEVAPPIFQVGVRYVLTDKGLQATILNNSIIEGKGKNYTEDGVKTKFSHDTKIYQIDIMPSMTTNPSSTSEGQIILPDGSGAIISFNSPKAALSYTAFSKRIYGSDKAFTFEETQETHMNKQLMFGMYGFLDKTEKKGVLAIVDRGASQTSIYANFKRSDTTKNVAYFTALFRENETVYVGSSANAFVKWAKERSNTDFSYIYQFLSEDQFVDANGNIEYNTLAKEYRDYLIDKYDLEEKDTTKNNVLALNFLGAFEKREVSFGFAHNVDYSLTTFEQAQNIIKELQEEGGLDFAVAYKAWTKDAMEPRATNNLKVSKVLGDAKGIKSLKQFLDENDINFYPEMRVISNKGYDYNFGNIKYTAKSVGGNYAMHREYDLATRRASDTVAPITMISPLYYVEFLNSFLKSYDKLAINGGYLTDIGNQRAGDYARTRTTYAEKAKDYQIAALDRAKESMDSVMLSSPFDYALKYVDFAVDVPLESTLLGYYDYSIPFYQLVVSGLFDYAGPAVNYDSEKNLNWYILKAIETGSNLQFILSAEDTKNLLNTDYTMFYNTYYANWKNEIIRMNNLLNNVGIHNANLDSHRILQDNVYEVKYDNGMTVIINYTNSFYYDYNSGLSVRPNWFVITEEANV